MEAAGGHIRSIYQHLTEDQQHFLIAALVLPSHALT